MNAKAEHLYREALGLPASERVALATRLLELEPNEPEPAGEDLRAIQAALDSGLRDVEAGRIRSADDLLRELDEL